MVLALDGLRRSIWPSVLTIGAIGGWIAPVTAQSVIVPDDTLGAEVSIVQPRNGFDGVTGGAVRGTGLFHSFSQFNISNPAGAYFLVRPDIQNIFARVTGSQGSTINGPIGTKIDNIELSPSSASLFLLNPNGIIFGPNAKLDLGGSFLATTASGFKFAGGQEFGAVNPQAAPLLTVSVPIGLQFGQKVGGIEVNGATLLPATVAKSLSLIGGDVKVSDSKLSTITGQLDVGAVGAGESVGLAPLPIGWKVDYAGVQNFQDIQIDRSQINAGAAQVGDFVIFPIDLQLQGRRIAISDNSFFQYEYRDVKTPKLRSGKIKINASESVDLNNSAIFNATDGTIPTPGIEINTGKLNLSNQSNILIRQDGGTAGNVDINASQGVLLQDGKKGLSQIFVANYSQGDRVGGEISITAPSLEIYAGSRLGTLLVSEGRAGDVNVNVDRLVVSGEKASGSLRTPSEISSGSDSESVGDTGNINILARSVGLTDGGTINIGRFGQGQPGTIDLQVKRAIVVSGATSQGLSSGVTHIQRQQTSTLDTSMPGIKIRAERLLLENGGAVRTTALDDGDSLGIDIQVDEDVTIQGSVLQPIISRSDGTLIFPASTIATSKLGGIGNGGNIQIRAKTLRLLAGGAIESDISRSLTERETEIFQGKAGDILITASDRVLVAGQKNQSFSSTLGVFAPSSISSSVSSNGNAKGGKVLIQTGILQVLDGGKIASDISGRGQAGAVEINTVGDVTIAGISSDGDSSSISSFSAYTAQGDAGSVTLRSQNLNIMDGGLISTTTRNRGQAGKILIEVKDDITLKGQSSESYVSNISSSSRTFTPEELADQIKIAQALGFNDPIIATDNLGNGGTIQIAARNLRMSGRSLIFATSSGRGAAGSILINLRDQAILNDAEIRTSATQTSGGNIDVTARGILLRNDANIKTNVASGNGKGGNITLTAPGGIVLLEDSDILAFAPEGQGGNIILNTQALLTRTYKPSPSGVDLLTLDTNGFVDINASGATSGIISLPTLNPLQNNRPALPNNLIDPTNQLDRSCLARNPQTGKFYITGAGGIPPQPGDPSLSSYSTLPVASTEAAPTQIVEADGLYPLENGKFVFGRRCQTDRSR